MFVAFIEGYKFSDSCNTMEDAVDSLIEMQELDQEDIENIQIAEVLPTKVKLPSRRFQLE